MKVSQFNLFLEEHNIIFNSLTRSMAVLSEADLHGFKQTPFDINFIDQDLLDDYLECGFIVPDDVDELQSLKYRYWKSKFDTSELHITIMTTLKCNFRCTYCFEHHQNIDITDQTMNGIKEFVRYELTERKRYKSLSVDWYGGEPLCNKNAIISLSGFFKDLCNQLSVNYSSSITTNGYYFTPEMQNDLFEVGVRHAQITLDGSKTMHNSRRSISNYDTFTTIVDNINGTNNKWTISVRVNVDRNNAYDIKSIIDVLDNKYNNIGIYACIVTPALDSRYQVGDYNIIIPYILDFYKYGLEKGFDITNISSLLFNDYKSCVVGSDNHMIISPDGKIFKCGESFECEDSGYVGNIDKNGKVTLFENKLTKWNIDPFSIEKCRKCTFLPICYGGCILKRITKRDNICMWELTHNYLNYLELLYQLIIRG